MDTEKSKPSLQIHQPPASDSQSRGHRFDPGILHHLISILYSHPAGLFSPTCQKMVNSSVAAFV
jgi:hypothetical protein